MFGKEAVSQAHGNGAAKVLPRPSSPACTVVVITAFVQPGSVQVYNIPLNPYQFEAFYDVTQEKHTRMLAQLAHQKHLYPTFCGEDGSHCFTLLVPYDEQQWQHLDSLAA